MTNILEKFNQKQAEKSIGNSQKMVNFKPGDTVAVSYRITEETSTRLQVFEGVVIGRSTNMCDYDSNFIVRKISHNVGVERKFLFHSPLVEKIDIISKGVVRRGKLYYLRKLRGKSARIKKQLFTSTKKLAKVAVEAPAAVAE